MEKEQNVFEILNQVDVSKKIKQKIGLSYLSWSDAWAELKKIFPEVLILFNSSNLFFLIIFSLTS